MPFQVRQSFWSPLLPKGHSLLEVGLKGAEGRSSLCHPRAVVPRDIAARKDEDKDERFMHRRGPTAKGELGGW